MTLKNVLISGDKSEQGGTIWVVVFHVLRNFTTCSFSSSSMSASRVVIASLVRVGRQTELRNLEIAEEG